MSYVLVHNQLSEGVCNSVPFSWRIRDYLDELWVHAQYVTEAEGEPGARWQGVSWQEEGQCPVTGRALPF